MSEHDGAAGERPFKGPLRRALDVCVLAPMGLAVKVVEDLPELVGEGRRRVELELANARVVGRFVVSQKQRDLSERLDGILHDDASPRGPETAGDAHSGNGTGTGTDEPTASEPEVPPPAPPPAADPVAAAIVGGALADYDTLSASQVVRRLESLGPEELRAVQRYEASHRNRRTILNRAGQLLEEGPSAVATD